MTAGPQYTLEALLDIFENALEAVAIHANPKTAELSAFLGWQYAFAKMTRREQAKWLLRCVKALTMGEVAWIDKYLEEAE